MRKKFEFYCTECKKYFDFVLNTSLNGNYRVHCPNCGHIHYRVLTDGKITEGRFTNTSNCDSMLIEDICPMKSSCRDSIKEKNETFISELWERTVSELI